MIRRLFVWVYTMPYGVLLLAGITFPFVLAKLRRRWRALPGGLLVLWAGAVLCYTVLSRSRGSGFTLSLVPLHTYRSMLNGGTRELLRSNFMNGLLFYPAGVLMGFLLPRRRRGWTQLLLTAAVFGCLSLAIELTQYTLQLGHFEMDDILHNTLGVIIGWAACRMVIQNQEPDL